MFSEPASDPLATVLSVVEDLDAVAQRRAALATAAYCQRCGTPALLPELLDALGVLETVGTSRAAG